MAEKMTQSNFTPYLKLGFHEGKSFGAYIEGTACIQDGEYIGEQYKDLGLVNALVTYDQRQELDVIIVQNGLN